jgi:hypothetical protein
MDWKLEVAVIPVSDVDRAKVPTATTGPSRKSRRTRRGSTTWRDPGVAAGALFRTVVGD